MSNKDLRLKDLDISRLKFISRSCDLCGHESEELVATVEFYGLQFSFVRCPECGLIYQNPLLDPDSRRHIYETIDYWDHKHCSNSRQPMLNYYAYLDEVELRKFNAEIRLGWLKSYLERKSRILDLGCADGLFVDLLQNNGYRASGMDISEPMVQHGKSAFGVDLHCGDFEGQWPFDEYFDAITCFATISNIITPSRVFANIRKHLKIGGHLFLNFGDWRRLASRLLGLRLYLYRPTASAIYCQGTVKAYCEKNGLKVRRIFNDVQVVPLVRVLGFFRIPAMVRALEALGLENFRLRLPLLTGYAAQATRTT